MRKLTRNQIWCIEEMRHRKMDMLAAVFEEHWRKGETHYIDDRVKCNLKGAIRRIGLGNAEAEKNMDEAMPPCSCGKQIVWFYEQPTVLVCEECEITLSHYQKTCRRCGGNATKFVKIGG